MKPKSSRWEEPARGIRILRLYRTELNPDWPRILILELTDERFREFEHDPLSFDREYKLYYPESPISWMSCCAKPPYVKEIPPAADPASWSVVLMKGGMSKVCCAAFPHE